MNEVASPETFIAEHGIIEIPCSSATTAASQLEHLDDDGQGDAPLPLPLLWFNEIKPVVNANDFVQGLLTNGGAAVVYGESNSGKTFWATDLALHVAAGLEWHGKRVKQGAVIYCVLEGGFGFKNRVSAWKMDRGMDEEDNLPFAAIPCGLNLLDPEVDTPRLIETIKAAAQQVGMQVGLVVIDTLSRAMAGGNENAPDDMGALVRNMDAIRAATGACVLFVHHSGKDQARGARGHSLLRAAIDTEIEVVADDATGARTARVVKQRDLQKGAVHGFTLRVIDLGKNEYGEMVTSCLVDGSAAVGVKKLPGGHAKRAYEVLVEALAAEGVSGHSGIPEGFLSVREKQWRDWFYERAMPGAEAKTKEKAFRRASDQLLAGRFVAMASGRIWRPDLGRDDFVTKMEWETSP
jgi:hypothetical protein